jgi:hypothetical protein
MRWQHWPTFYFSSLNFVWSSRDLAIICMVLDGIGANIVQRGHPSLQHDDA